MNVADTLEHGLDMSPQREERRVNVEQLSFPLPMVLAMLAAIALTAFAVGGLQYVLTGTDRAAQAQMQSDIRDMRTRMENQTEVHKLEKELLDAQLAAMKAAIDASGLRSSAMALSQELQKTQKER